MKRLLWVMGVMLAACAALLPCAYAVQTVKTLRILPVTDNELLIYAPDILDDDYNLVNDGEVVIHGRQLASNLLERKDTLQRNLGLAAIDPTLFASHDTLDPSTFIRPWFGHATVSQQPDGIHIQFLNTTDSPLIIKVLTTDKSFTETVFTEMPLFPQWPHAPAANAISVNALDRSLTAFDQKNTDMAITDLLPLLNTNAPQTPVLFPLAGALSLYDENWIQALCIYGEGARRYPARLGLRYSALLYQFNQRDKAILMLQLLLKQPGLALETLAEANFMMGTLQEEAHAYDVALPFLQKAAQTYGDQPIVMYNLAIAYEGVQNAQAALAAYKDAKRTAGPDLRGDINRQIARLQKPMPNSGPIDHAAKAIRG